MTTAAPTTLLSTIADGNDAPVILDGTRWIVSPVDDVVLVSDPVDRDLPNVWLRRAWLTDDATLADVVALAIAESVPRAPVLAGIAAVLLAGRTVTTPRVTCGRIYLATDATPRWGCYRDPGGVLLTGEHVVPFVTYDKHRGFADDVRIEDDASPFGAALAFVREVGVTAARAALARHPAGCGACDPETACGDCALAYGVLDALEGDAGMVDDTAADARREEQGT